MVLILYDLVLTLSYYFWENIFIMLGSSFVPQLYNQQWLIAEILTFRISSL